MSAEAVGEHVIWLIQHRRTATDDAFEDRLAQLICESAAGNPVRPRKTHKPGVRAAFLLEYRTQQGKWGAFKALLKKYDVKEGTARKWISDNYQL